MIGYPELPATVLYFGGGDTAVANAAKLANEVQEVEVGKVVGLVQLAK